MFFNFTGILKGWKKLLNANLEIALTPTPTNNTQ